MIVDGFFSSDKDILVPVKRSPSDVHLSLIPSTEAYLSNSKYIQTFLPVPLVPFELGNNEFFKTLKRRQWIEEIDQQIIVTKIHQSILSFEQFLGLLRWLCTNDVKTKSYIKEILSQIRYRENDSKTIIKLDQIEFYDTLNLPSLPLPSSVIPSSIVAHLSREDLQRRLGLSGLTVRTLIEYYLDEKQHHLFLNEDTSRILLSFLSERWNQFNQNESNQMKEVLSRLKCLPTRKGMKMSNESYIPSSHLSEDLPLIKLYIPQIESTLKDEYPVSIEFLKSIGCRTIYISNKQSTIPNEDFQSNEQFLDDLLKQRKSLSENDLLALKHNQCIRGTDQSKKGKYKPSELHFPSVATRLQWENLLILDWPDIDPRSREYAFLKELGVKEVPDLKKLISRIDEEYQNSAKNLDGFKLPKALVFFAEYFQEHYSKGWKNSNIQIPFLPSLLPSTDMVILTTPQYVFKGTINRSFPFSRIISFRIESIVSLITS